MIEEVHHDEDEHHEDDGHGHGHGGGGHGHGAKPHSLVSSAISALIVFILMFGLCCVYGLVMFVEDYNKQHRPLGVKMNLATGVIMGGLLSTIGPTRIAI